MALEQQQKGQAERKTSGLPWAFGNTKSTPQQHTSSNQASLPNPSKTVPLTGSKHSNIWPYGDHSHSKHHIHLWQNGLLNPLFDFVDYIRNLNHCWIFFPQLTLQYCLSLNLWPFPSSASWLPFIKKYPMTSMYNW